MKKLKQIAFDALVGSDAVNVIDLYVKSGNWYTALSTASLQQDRSLLDRYLAIHTKKLLSQERFDQAIRVFDNYGASADPELLPIFEELANKVLNSRPNSQSYKTLAALRNLFAVLKQLDEKCGYSEFSMQFEQRLYVAHFAALGKALAEVSEQNQLEKDQSATSSSSTGMTAQDLNTLRLRLSLSSLRYVGILRPDKAFYDAGSSCKSLGGADYEKMTFVLFNQLLDILGSIEDGKEKFIDSGLFKGTDVPTSFALPRDKFLTEDEEAEVKAWLMSVNCQNMKELRFDERVCYEASTVDLERVYHSICVISGFPVVDDGYEMGILIAKKQALFSFIEIVEKHPIEELLDVKQFLQKWSAKP